MHYTINLASKKFLNHAAIVHIMDKSEFAQELDSYLSKRNKPVSAKFWKGLFARAPKSAQSVEEPEPQPVTVSTAVEVPVTENDEATPAEYDSDKKGVLSRMLEWFVTGSPEKHDAVAQEEVSSALAEKELRDDMRELAKISISTFRKLPAHKIREFKGSVEYDAFRNILKKHGLSGNN